jgi:hypothetical protein
MGANDKLQARYRAVELQRKKNEERARRDRANAADAESIRATLHRVGAVNNWERKRFDQAVEKIRADAVKRRADHFHGLQALVEQMRGRGLTFAQIAELVGVDIREIQAELRRARAGGAGKRGSTVSPAARSRSADVELEGAAVAVDSISDGVERNETAVGTYDPTRCVRCDAVMLDEDAAPRLGRRRLYCSDMCRRDASAARTAAQRYGAPIRVVEVPKAAASQRQSVETSGLNRPVAPMDSANNVLDDGEASRALLARLTEQARLKKLDRATLTAARELSNAVHPQRSW